MNLYFFPLNIYTSVIRPHFRSIVRSSCHWYLEYWKNTKKSHKNTGSLKKNNYNERLKIIYLTTLEKHWSREDLIYMYKIARSQGKIKWENTKSPINRETSSHNFRFHRKSFKTKRKNCHLVILKHNLFSNWVASLWNKLNKQNVWALTVDLFKARLDKFTNTAAIAQNLRWGVYVCLNITDRDVAARFTN